MLGLSVLLCSVYRECMPNLCSVYRYYYARFIVSACPIYARFIVSDLMYPMGHLSVVYVVLYIILFVCSGINSEMRCFGQKFGFDQG